MRRRARADFAFRRFSAYAFAGFAGFTFFGRAFCGFFGRAFLGFPLLGLTRGFKRRRFGARAFCAQSVPRFLFENDGRAGA